jgi:hypothetical protein
LTFADRRAGRAVTRLDIDHLNGCIPQRRTGAHDPNPPVEFLQSCPTLSLGFSRFASTKQPFVTSGSRPGAVSGERLVRGVLPTNAYVRQKVQLDAVSPARHFERWRISSAKDAADAAPMGAFDMPRQANGQGEATSI